MSAPETYTKKDFMVKRSLMKSRLIKKENYKSRWFFLTRVCLCYCDGGMEVRVCLLFQFWYAFSQSCLSFCLSVCNNTVYWD